MTDLRIVDAPVLLQESITDDVKMPTGGLGNFSVRLGDILWYVITKEQLANKNYVDLSSKSVKDSLDEHIADKVNPHEVTKAQVGLGNVDNTADVDKPVSNATKSAIITATTDMATKAYVNQKDNLKADKATTLSGYGITDAYTKDETCGKIEIDNALTLKADVAYVDGKDGDLTTLETADKTNLVKAINEVYDTTKGVVTLYDRNVEAGAGANGWTDLLITNENGITQQTINNEQVNATRFKTLSDAIAAAKSANKVLIIPTEKYTLTSDLSIPVDTQILKGATFDLNGKTLTFEKDLQAGRYKIFEGEGVVKGDNIQTAYTDWFGAVGDGYSYNANSLDLVGKKYAVNGMSYLYGVGASPAVNYTDNTEAINKTININARKTVITNSGNGILMIDTLKSVNFTHKKLQYLIVEATLKAIKNNTKNGRVLLTENLDDCTIEFTTSGQIVGELLEHDFSDATYPENSSQNPKYSEWVHGLWVANCTNSKFIDIKSSFNVGDGCYVAYPSNGETVNAKNENINFIRGFYNYNRRTGYVIEIGNNIYSSDVVYQNTGIVLPAVGTCSGVDIEPFADDSIMRNYVDNISFINCKAYSNKGGGLRLERTYNAIINGCHFIGNNFAVELHGCGRYSQHDPSNYKKTTIKNDGVILISNNYIRDNNFALLNSYNLSKYVFVDNTIINCLECSFVVRAVNTSIKNNTILNSRYCDLIQMIDTSFDGNKFIGFIGSRDWQTPILNIGGSSSLNHFSHDYTGRVLVSIEILNGGSGLTYDNINISVSGSLDTNGNAKVYPVIENGVLVGLQIAEYGYKYPNVDSCIINIAGGSSNPVIRTVCEIVTSTSSIINNTFKASSALTTTIGSLNLGSFAYTDNKLSIRDNYFDPRLSIYDDIGGNGSKNTISIATSDLVQRLSKGTLVKDVDKLRYVKTKGIFGKFGTEWKSGMTVTPETVVYTSSGKMYHSRSNGVTTISEPSGYDEWWSDGNIYWTFMGDAPVLSDLPSVAQTVQNATGTDDTSTKLNALITSLKNAGIIAT